MTVDLEYMGDESFVLLYVMCMLLWLQEADFYMYSLYSKNKPKSDDIMAECGSIYFAVCICMVECL